VVLRRIDAGVVIPPRAEVFLEVSVHLLLVQKIAEMHLVSVWLDRERECSFTAIFQLVSMSKRVPGGLPDPPGCNDNFIQR
jgi:hypothetical protein